MAFRKVRFRWLFKLPITLCVGVVVYNSTAWSIRVLAVTFPLAHRPWAWCGPAWTTYTCELHGLFSKLYHIVWNVQTWGIYTHTYTRMCMNVIHDITLHSIISHNVTQHIAILNTPHSFRLPRSSNHRQVLKSAWHLVAVTDPWDYLTGLNLSRAKTHTWLCSSLAVVPWHCLT